MWTTIDKETYMQKAKGLKPIESFTDPDGTLEFSCGRPQIVTIWGIVGARNEEDTPVVKCEMRKNDRHVLTWDTEYFEYVNPAVKDSVINNMNNNFDPAVKAEEVKDDVAPAEQATEATQEAQAEGEAEGTGALVD